MEKYEVSKTLGEGAFGMVMLAFNKQEGNGIKLAIKMIKQNYRSWEECVKLRELRALKVRPQPPSSPLPQRAHK